MLNKKGFGLLEVMIAVAIFVVFAVGIYSGIQYVFKVVYQSRLRILESSILNEQIEIIRNLSFYDVGIINGSPAGVLTKTETIRRNDIDFLITRTIRNIDDPFDGTIDGEPKDLVPADYKMVQIDVICSHCSQQEPLSVITYVSPKLLEGDPTHGALFIKVFDADARPVQGASVQVVATSTNPAIDLIEFTDNEGMVKLLDLGEGMDVYHITVSKPGYTTDQTLSPSIENPYPIKPPASVQAQNVSEISFSIDKISSINLNTINSICQPVANASITLAGSKLRGTEPEILKFTSTIHTNASGNYLFNNLEWDIYDLYANNYDVLGSIPASPLILLPGMEQNTQLILGPNTANSLLVLVRDNITKQPLSNAQVKVYSEGYEKNKETGVGFIRQTDWSGGIGQQDFLDETKYWSDDGKIEVNNPAGDLKLLQLQGKYVFEGSLESSVFDFGLPVNFVNLNWEPFSQLEGVGENGVRFQIATSNTSTPEQWNFLGPDGTSESYYNTENIAINEVHNNSQYLRYKLFLTTNNNDFTPIVSDINISYITSCTPPGQAYFGALTEGLYNVEVLRSGYQPKLDTINVKNDLIFGMDLVSL